jgi:hypothetical protein
VTGSVLAATVNSPGAAVLTFYFPVGLFVVIGTVLYLLLSRPHRRVPGRLASAQASGATAPSAADGPSGSVSGGAAAVPPTSPAGDAPGDESAAGDGPQRPAATAEGTEAGE